MSETRNIVIVGGSNAGLGVAHSFLKHTYPGLRTSQTSIKYQVHVIDPSTHYWWRICAPRTAVSVSDFPHEKTFFPIAEGFKQYDKDAFVFHQAKASSVDTSARTITFTDTSDQSQSITYYALVIATGSNTPTALTSLQGDHKKSIAVLDATNKRLPTAKSIVIGGGGPVGVETAGEIGEKLNGRAGWFKNRPETKTKVTLVTSSDKLLPVLNKGFSAKAEKFLNAIGVDVVYSTRVEKVDLSAQDAELMATEGDSPHGKSGSDQSIIYLSNGEKLTADIYIPAIGAKYNTGFLPQACLAANGAVKCDKDLRVEGLGERVYVCGDAQSNTAGGMMSLQAAVPVVSANLAYDLGKEGAEKQQKKAAKEKEFMFKLGETQIVPIGRSKGVGAFQGFNMPSAMCWAAKGRDYMLWMAPPMVNGKKW